MFLWTTPMPPARARAMAMSASVTVSMAADRKGICSRMRLGQLGRGVDLRGNDLGVARHQQHVVEGQGLAEISCGRRCDSVRSWSS